MKDFIAIVSKDVTRFNTGSFSWARLGSLGQGGREAVREMELAPYEEAGGYVAGPFREYAESL